MPAVAAPAVTDWLRHQLTVSGPAAAVARFSHAARGTNAAPWRLDLDAEEARLLAPMASAGAAAAALARALRDAIARRHDRVLAGWAEPGSCPLDLHRLVPVPADILQLGEDHPAAQHWLRTHWGTTRPLHQVRRRDAPDRRRRRAARLTLDFLSADWTPWQAIQQLRRDWPLAFDIRPDYRPDARFDCRPDVRRPDGQRPGARRLDARGPDARGPDCRRPDDRPDGRPDGRLGSGIG